MSVSKGFLVRTLYTYNADECKRRVIDDVGALSA